MSKINILDEILDFAIGNEIDASNFYKSLASKSKNKEMKEVLLNFAAEERGHRKILEDVKKGKNPIVTGGKIVDLKIADYVVDIKPSDDMSYQDIITLAMKKEKASFALYTDLANQSPDPEAKKLFTALAQQEAKHKLRFELEYDNIVLKED
ncbi:MAG: ferritin family protein [Phycisphaerales bacterium]